MKLLKITKEKINKLINQLKKMKINLKINKILKLINVEKIIKTALNIYVDI